MFAQPFWPEGFFDVVCTDSFIPEFWVTPPAAYSHQHEKPTKSFQHASQAPASQGGSQASYSQPAAVQDAETEARQEHKQNVEQEQTPQQQQSWQQQQQAVHCMVGFVAGSKAEQISKLRQNSVVIRTLSQLDDMFRKSCMRHGISVILLLLQPMWTAGIAHVDCALMYI